MIKEVEGFGGRNIIGYWNEETNIFIPNYKTFFKEIKKYKKSTGKQLSKIQITKQPFLNRYNCFLSFSNTPNQRTIAIIGNIKTIYYVLPKVINIKMWRNL